LNRPSEIEDLAHELGYQPEVLEKVIRLTILLRAISEHEFLGPRLILKGGTAINLCFGKLKRLSVDLDFNYIGKLDREEMLREQPVVDKFIRWVGSSLQYVIQSGNQGHAGKTWHFNYLNLAGNRDRIEVDVSFKNRLPLLPPEQYPVWVVPGSPSLEVRSCSKEELIAGKLKALLDRVAARDVFDAAWVTSLVPADEYPRFRKLFVLYGGTLAHPLYNYKSERIQRLTQREIDTRLVPMLREGIEVDRATLISQAREAVKPLLALDGVEREYSSSINRGEYLPELLLTDWPELVERLQAHPALLWKAENAQRRKR